MIDFNQMDKDPQSPSIEHIFEILNDVKTKELPVSDALDSLAYWYHEAFQKGDIRVEQPQRGAGSEAGNPQDGVRSYTEDIWT